MGVPVLNRNGISQSKCGSRNGRNFKKITKESMCHDSKGKTRLKLLPQYLHVHGDQLFEERARNVEWAMTGWKEFLQNMLIGMPRVHCTR